MGVMILAGAGDSLMLWLLLLAVVGLTYWECHERGYRTRLTLWWLSVVLLSHALGYIALRLFGPGRSKPANRR